MSLSAVFKYMAKQVVNCRNMVVTVKADEPKIIQNIE